MNRFDIVKGGPSRRWFAEGGLVSVALCAGLMTAGCGAADTGDVALDDPAVEQQALAPLAMIQVIPINSTIAQGTRQKFTAVGIYADNTQRDVTRSVTWTSSMPQVAPIGNAGVFKGVAVGVSAGQTTISAQLDYFSVSAILTVVPR